MINVRIDRHTFKLIVSVVENLSSTLPRVVFDEVKTVWRANQSEVERMQELKVIAYFQRLLYHIIPTAHLLCCF